MSFPVQSNRRDNNNNYRSTNRANPAQAARSQWVPRGSSVTVTEVIPRAPVDNTVTSHVTRPVASTTNVVAQAVAVEDMNVQGRSVPPPYRSRNYQGPRGGIDRHQQQRKQRNKEEKDRGTEGKRSKDESLPLLVQEIQDKLTTNAVECMICYDMVRRSAPVWSCSGCYSIFHLSCIKKWARAPTSVDLLAEKSQGFNWRCPGCQAVQLTSSKEIRYVCFCGKRPDPPSDLYLTPHSCGEPCGKPLEKEMPGSNMNREDLCPHSCVLQCHPGPCPPCKAFAPPRRCPCGKKVITTRCSDRKTVLTCGHKCEKLLTCGRHSCEQTCHVGPCDPCQVLFNASCFCKKKNDVIPCGSMLEKGEVKVEDGVFSCNSTCGKKLSCGNHLCSENCHPGPCGECDLTPAKIKSCCCGKTSLKEERESCLDPVPTCSQMCGKTLPCGVHLCRETCHSGLCPPCPVLVTQKCRCRSTSRSVECYKTAIEEFTCDKPCGRKKNCGRHRCSERCCPLSGSDNLASGHLDPHLCSMPCGKKLRCGQHSCPSLCHSGHCPPCFETIFTDLTCACGNTSIPPPLPCGTPFPSCQYPCSVPQPCGHPATHSCHFGDCPPCTIPIAKECIGGHVVLRNIPCGSKDIRCNKLCGKTRRCGLHACARICHPSPCDSSPAPVIGSRASCGQTCGAPRRDCKHTCASLCHPSASCPDVRCEFPVTITCSCGRISATVPCDAGGNSGAYMADTVLEASLVHKLPAPLQPVEGNGKVSLGQRKLMCDDDCAKAEKKKVLADAFGVITPNLETLHFGETSVVSEVLSDLLRREPKWVLSVEERCKFLVLGRGRGGINALKVHVFCPMMKEKRDALRLIADRWKLSVSSAGWDPKRFIVVHVTPKSKAPTRILGSKSSVPVNMLQAPGFDPVVDMDPRLVVALFDLPRDADISALVLRFGGECELVWLNDKNALAVFSDPARAATAMRRLDHGSLYHGAVSVPQNGSASMASSGAHVWGSKDGNAVSANTWKKAVMKEAVWGESSWGAEDSNELVDSNPSVWKAKEPAIPETNRWSVLEYETTSSSSKQPGNSELLGSKPGALDVSVTEPTVRNKDVPGERLVEEVIEMTDVVDDWEKEIAEIYEQEQNLEKAVDLFQSDLDLEASGRRLLNFLLS